ncbi:hypothetical protein MN608_02246 [Microdochium nivale]|nr:hypothetical protein MN608_02246 [Microdochium nivale]
MNSILFSNCHQPFVAFDALRPGSWHDDSTQLQTDGAIYCEDHRMSQDPGIAWTGASTADSESASQPSAPVDGHIICMYNGMGIRRLPGLSSSDWCSPRTCSQLDIWESNMGLPYSVIKLQVHGLN